MKNIIIVLSLLLANSGLQAQQEAQYTQGQFNNFIVLNPAYAGYADCQRLGLRYRNQWAGFEGSPTTFNLTYDTDVKERLGLGAVLVYDKLGIENSLKAELSLNYQLPLNTAKASTLAIGLKGGYANIKADFSKLNNVDISDPLYNPTMFQKLNLGYIGFGALYYTDRFFAGISSPRLIGIQSTSVRTDLIQAHLYTTLGYTFDVGSDMTLTPSLLLKYQEAAPLEADIALNLWMHDRVGVGASYRTGDAFCAMLQYQFDKLVIGYAYDFTTSSLRSQTMGGHEIFLGFRFCKDKPTKRLPGYQDPTDVKSHNL